MKVILMISTVGTWWNILVFKNAK